MAEDISIVLRVSVPGETGHSHGSRLVTEWRRSWRQGLATLMGTAVSYSVWSSASSLFVQPLQDTFGWSRGDISFAHNAGLIASFSAPVIGRLVDRVGVRPVLLAGLCLTMFCYMLFASMNGSLPLYYALYLVFAVVGMSTTGVTYTRVITGAFHDTRGSALAITRSGLALSGALLPALLFFTISRWGVVGGYLTLAVLIAAIALPLAWLWIPSRRDEVPHSKATSLGEADRWTTLIRKPKILLLCLASALNYAPVVALLSQMMPLAVSKGMQPAMAVGAVSAVGMAAMVGALVSGFLVDRFWAPIVAAVLNLGPAIGCLLLLPGSVEPWMLFVAVLMIGLGQGAEIDIVAFMIARYFGLRSYATIYGMSTLLIGLSVAISAALIGYAYDRFGNYDIALMAASASFALAACCYLLMGAYPLRDPDVAID